MIVRMGLLTRRPEIGSAEFRRRWRDVHGPLAASPAEACGAIIKITSSTTGSLPSIMRAVPGRSMASRVVVRQRGRHEQGCGVGGISGRRASTITFVGTTGLITAVQNVVVPVDVTAGPLVKRMSILTRGSGSRRSSSRTSGGAFMPEAVRKFPESDGLHPEPRRRAQRGPRPAGGSRGSSDRWNGGDVVPPVADIEAAFRSPAANVSQTHALSFIAEITTFLVEAHEVVKADPAQIPAA